MKNPLALICTVVMALCLAGCGKSIEEANVGETVEFGKYNGNAIEWIVTKEENGKKLLLSKYAICPIEFDKHALIETVAQLSDIRKHPYSHSDISKYLDKDFMYDCFTDEEVDKIIESKVITKVETSKNTYQEESWHSVFLPVYEEIEAQYIKCKVANYAEGIDTLKDEYRKRKQRLSDFQKTYEDNCYYWTREAFGSGKFCKAVYIGPFGTTNTITASDDAIGLRPMMWVKAK